MSELVRLQNVAFGYGRREVVAVDHLALSPGRCVGIYGPNGSGKSTMVGGIIGLRKPMRGSVMIDSSTRTGFLPQARSLQLHWPMSGRDVVQMICTARRRFGWLNRPPPALERAIERLEVQSLLERPFSQLSGGQQQRLLLAGALGDEPQLLVLDEPSTGLDTQSQDRLLDAVQQELSAGLCVVLISHELHDLLRVANEVAVLETKVQGPSLARLCQPRDLVRRELGGEVLA